eukprot:1194775-Prorocentrum_minimum.AAC.2
MYHHRHTQQSTDAEDVLDEEADRTDGGGAEERVHAPAAADSAPVRALAGAGGGEPERVRGGAAAALALQPQGHLHLGHRGALRGAHLRHRPPGGAERCKRGVRIHPPGPPRGSTWSTSPPSAARWGRTL